MEVKHFYASSDVGSIPSSNIFFKEMSTHNLEILDPPLGVAAM